MTSSAFIVPKDKSREIQTVMDKGFAKDPSVPWILDTPEKFNKEHHRNVQMSAEPAYEHGCVHATDGYHGAAIWYPPGISVSDAAFEDFKTLACHPEKLDTYANVAERCDTFRPKGAHWTLELIAVDPASQGLGIGRALIEFGLERCDRSGLPVFLPSTNRANLPFNSRLGFVSAGQADDPEAPSLYAMVRNSRRG